jgi:hypothetical protein
VWKKTERKDKRQSGLSFNCSCHILSFQGSVHVTN